jgi:hypothetical protein
MLRHGCLAAHTVLHAERRRRVAALRHVRYTLCMVLLTMCLAQPRLPHDCSIAGAGALSIHRDICNHSWHCKRRRVAATCHQLQTRKSQRDPVAGT